MKSQSTKKDDVKKDVKAVYEELLSKCTDEEKEKIYIAITSYIMGLQLRK